MDRTQEPERPVAEYLKALFREMEIEGLVLLINVGDCVFPYVLHPREIADDPVATAENMVARGRFDLTKPAASPSETSRTVSLRALIGVDAMWKKSA
jgi:hypothetical protein